MKPVSKLRYLPNHKILERTKVLSKWLKYIVLDAKLPAQLRPVKQVVGKNHTPTPKKQSLTFYYA